MPPITFTIRNDQPNIPGVTLVASDTVTIQRQAGVYSLGTGDDAVGILGAGSNTITVDGVVFSDQSNGIRIDHGGNTLTISATGSVASRLRSAILLIEGHNIVTNNGNIDSFGVSTTGLLLQNIDGTNTIINNGQIRASTAISMEGGKNIVTNNGTMDTRGSFMVTMDGTFTNNGLVQGFGSFKFTDEDGLDVNLLTNNQNGTIQSFADFGVEGSEVADRIVNNGMIKGLGAAISLLEGADRYEGQLGTLGGSVSGGDGDDTLLGGAGAEAFFGDANNDTLNGGAGFDTLEGGTGNDGYTINRVVDGATYDTVTEAMGAGTDTVLFIGNAAGQSYTLPAEVEHLVIGGTLNTNGTGNNRPNSIVGNGATNVLNGREGLDTLTGGAGTDYFLFNTALSAANKDAIADFNVAADTIRLENAIFTGLVGAANATLSAGQFNINNANGVALEADDRIIYDQDHGQLWYDSNGSAVGGTIVNFASTTAYLTLTNADFFIV